MHYNCLIILDMKLLWFMDLSQILNHAKHKMSLMILRTWLKFPNHAKYEKKVFQFKKITTLAKLW